MPLLLSGAGPWKRRLHHLLTFSGVALLGALPDLLYHAAVFGSPWISESREWYLLSWRNILPTLQDMMQDGWFRRAEFGYLWPFIILGIWWQWRARAERPQAAMMGLSFLGILLFQLCYSALRFRDLISLFPWLGLWAGLGIAGLWSRVDNMVGTEGRRTLVLLLVLMALSVRTAGTLTLPWAQEVRTFGYVLASEREGYAELGRMVSAEAVVGTGLNSGAIERYAGRETVRPASWSDQEFARFVDELAEEERPFYLLDDGQEMERFLPRLRGRFLLHPLGEFELPTFGLGGQDYERSARLYALEKPWLPSLAGNPLLTRMTLNALQSVL